MASFIYRCFSGLLLLGLHFVNFHLCNRFLRPILLPLLFTTNDVRLVKSINAHLKEFDMDHEIPVSVVKNLHISKESNEHVLRLSNDQYSTIIFDLITSFSLQLIELFIIDILQFGDFEFRHLDWYITLSTLILFLTYITPSCILYNLIISDRYQSSQLKNMLNFTGIFVFWCLFLAVLYVSVVTAEVNGNFLQLSLYLLSLFGVSCLSILNGLGCITGCQDSWDWYSGNEDDNLKKKELELSYELRTLDALLSSQEANVRDLVWEQLIKIDSLTRDISLVRQNRKGINVFIKFSVWIYSIYKTLYGLVHAIKLVFYSIGIMELFIDYKRKETVTKNYTGNGDFLSNMISKIILVYIYYDRKTRSYSTFDEIVDENEEILNRIMMIVNVIISFVFFSFSFQNVLLTFKNFKTLSRKLVRLNEFELFNKLKNVLIQTNEINAIVMTKTLLNELTYLLVSEITGIYVVSTALLLNSVNMPIHLSQLFMSINEWKSFKASSIRSYINPDFMNDWFDRWFSVGCIGTILTIIVLDQVKTVYGITSRFDEEIV